MTPAPRPPGRPASAALFLAFLAALPLLVFGPTFVRGEAFLPADLLSYLAPYRASHPPAEDAAAWNVLRFDGITQFYPWRVQTARAFREGQIPLRNPYQFGAEGGTPLLANSQSAPLYPPNALFYLMPPDRVWFAFGLSAALHLFLAASGMFTLLRALGLVRGASALGAATFALSAPVITWLALPTFLAVSCWVPWLLWWVHRAHRHAGTRTGRLAAVGAGACGGLMLLAGHLQIALYGLLTALIFGLYLGAREMRARRVRALPWAGAAVAVGALALMVAAPQVLPSVELSRVSHRVAVRSMETYRGNMGTALPPRNLVTLLAPDFFGHPNRGVYWNDSDRGGNNYAEWALYVGVLPLLLAVYAVALPWKTPAAAPGDAAATQGAPLPPERGAFTLLALLALLLAMGTPLNLLLFWLVPGFASTGNPARVLVVLALALSALAAMGAQALTGGAAFPAAARSRALLVAVSVPVLAAAFGMARAAAFAPVALPPGTPFAAALEQAAPGLMVAGVWLALAVTALALLPRLTSGAVGAGRGPLARAALVALAVADLGFWGAGYNPSVAPEKVYPVTPGIAFLQQNGGNALIAAINRSWALGQTPPRNAVLPPNGLTVYGLHDVGGYDSLFPAQAKERVKEAGSGEDPSPPANGNIVFVKDVPTAVNLGARYIALAPEAAQGLALPPDAPLAVAYSGDDLVILENRTGRDFVPAPVEAPASFRVGLFLSGCALAVFVGAVVAAARKRPRP